MAAITEHGGERFALLLVDQTLKRQGIGLFADMPIGSPGKLTKGRDAASFGHARQAEIEFHPRAAPP